MRRQAFAKARARVAAVKRAERAKRATSGDGTRDGDRGGAARDWSPCWSVALSTMTVVVLTHLAVSWLGIRFDVRNDLSRWWYADGVFEFNRGMDLYHAAGTPIDAFDGYGAVPTTDLLSGFARSQHGATSRNDRMAHELFSDAADMGNVDAQHYLGVMHERGEGGLVPSSTEAARWFRKAAAQGHVRSQFKVGSFFFHGLGGLGEDKARGVAYWRRAALGGNKEAQFNMGVVYDSGNGTPRNATRAVRFWRMAAEQGDVAAQCNVGSAYHRGSGAPRNDSEALRWWRMAARGGRAEAALSIGLFYKHGEGDVDIDATEAFRWLSIAADHARNPLAEAMHHIAVAYRSGDGVKPSLQKALQYLLRAAHAKFALSQHELGVHHALLAEDAAGMPDAVAHRQQAQDWCVESLLCPTHLICVAPRSSIWLFKSLSLSLFLSFSPSFFLSLSLTNSSYYEIVVNELSYT